MNDREYKKVIAYVKEQVTAGKLHAGDKLPTERELVELLSLGRNSIREALRIMDAMGMIKSRQGSGNYLVANIEKTFTESMELMLLIKQVDYVQISQLRRAIELYVYADAVWNLSDSQLWELNEIVEKMKQNAGKKRASLDKQFHDRILITCSNTLIISIMSSLSDVCSELIEKVITESSPEKKLVLMETHETMLKGLLHKDVLLGMQAINLHYDLIDTEVCYDGNTENCRKAKGIFQQQSDKEHCVSKGDAKEDAFCDTAERG